MSLEAKLRSTSLSSKSFTKTLPGWIMLKLVDVKPLRWFLSLGTSFESNTDSEFGYKQPMVCPAVRATHCLGHPYILSILPSGEDTSYQVSVSAPKTFYFDGAGGIQCS